MDKRPTLSPTPHHSSGRFGRGTHLENDMFREYETLDVLELLEPREDLLHRPGARLLLHGADTDHHLWAENGDDQSDA